MSHADEITASVPDEQVALEALKPPRLGGKELTWLSRQPTWKCRSAYS